MIDVNLVIGILKVILVASNAIVIQMAVKTRVVTHRLDSVTVNLVWKELAVINVKQDITVLAQMDVKVSINLILDPSIIIHVLLQRMRRLF